MALKTTPGTPSAAALGATDTVQLTGSEQDFQALRSAFAQQGLGLHSSAPQDGATTYWVERWGLVRYLPNLHDAALFLVQIGGQL
jgi:hypothetical protein